MELHFGGNRVGPWANADWVGMAESEERFLAKSRLAILEKQGAGRSIFL